MANRYWVGGNGTWDASSTTHWSASSGGLAGASVPTSSDSVFFDQATTYTVTLANTTLNCLDWNVTAGSVTFTGTVQYVNVYGSIAFSAGKVSAFTVAAAFYIALRGTNSTITTNGVAISSSKVSIINASYYLLGAFSVKTLEVNNCTLNFNGYTITCTDTSIGFQIDGNSLISLNFGTNASIAVPSATNAINCSSSTSNIVNTTGTCTLYCTRANNQSISGGTQKYIGLTVSIGITGAYPNNYFTFFGNCTYENITNTTGDIIIQFFSYDITTVNNFTVNGIFTGPYPGIPTLQSTATPNPWYIRKASGTVAISWVNLDDSYAYGGATFIATYTGTTYSNNTGWQIFLGAGNQDITATNTNLSGTGYIGGGYTVRIDQTIIVTGLKATGVVNNTLIFNGLGIIAGVTGVSSTGYIGKVTIIRSVTLIPTGLYGTGVIGPTPNIWLSVVTSQTPNWTPIAT